MNLSSYVPKANVDHTMSGQVTATNTLDHSATIPRAKSIGQRNSARVKCAVL